MRAEAERLVKVEGLSYHAAARRLGVAGSTIGRWLDPAIRARANERERSRVRPKAPGRERVPVARLREAVQRCERFGTPRREICRRIGWRETEITRLARRLGEVGVQGRPPTTSIIESLAVRILRAIHLDPVDVGI